MNLALQDDPIGRFLAMARDHPGRLALECPGLQLSYAELEARVRRFAACFAAAGAPTVLIALPPGPDSYAAMFGAVLGGATYVPVNVATPTRKLGHVLDVIKPDVIVAEGALAAEFAALRPGCLIVEPRQVAAMAPLQGAGTRNPTAYMIMTSGSTGVPKAVVIPTSALAHYVDWICRTALFEAADRVAQFCHVSFDLSVLDIYGALNTGAALIPPMIEADRLFPAAFAQRWRISAWVSVPSAMELVMTGRQATPAMLGGVRLFAFAGEALREAHLAAIFKAAPDALVVNMYGPTETTVSMTAVPLRADDYRQACWDTVAIGHPIPGMGVHLVGGPGPDEGEIVVTGPQLATGYSGDAARTGRAFRTIDIDGQAVRGYFTGDWAQRRAGHVFFKGRIDGQMKVNGFRIESGEIVARLAECGWPIACVLKHGDVLTAVVESLDARALDPVALQARLRAELDPHSVPEAIFAIPTMPRTGNGKLDDKAVRVWLDQAVAERA